MASHPFPPPQTSPIATLTSSAMDKGTSITALSQKGRFPPNFVPVRECRSKSREGNGTKGNCRGTEDWKVWKKYSVGRSSKMCSVGSSWRKLQMYWATAQHKKESKCFNIHQCFQRSGTENLGTIARLITGKQSDLQSQWFTKPVKDGEPSWLSQKQNGNRVTGRMSSLGCATSKNEKDRHFFVDDLIAAGTSPSSGSPFHNSSESAPYCAAPHVQFDQPLATHFRAPSIYFMPWIRD